MNQNTAETSMDQRTLRHRLEDIPENIIPHVRLGFELLSKISDDRQSKILDYVLYNFAGKGAYDGAMAAKISGLDRKLVGDLLSSISLMVGAVYDINVSTQAFLEVAKEKLLPEDAYEAVSRALDQILENKVKIASEVAKQDIANSVLPSFVRFECELDNRYKFDDDDNIIETATTAVVYIKTDYKKDLFFQIDKKNIEHIVGDLQKILRRMEKLDQLNV